VCSSHSTTWFALTLVALLVTPAIAGQQAERYTLVSDKPFDDVLADLEFAIGEANFRLTERANIGAGIAERRGEDFPQATVLHFCNLEYARQLLRANPDILVYMPCRVSLREQDNQVTIDAWLLPEAPGEDYALRREVNDLLRRIVQFAAD
jgi:uncharacterized protein (DUF302 family)